MEFRTAWESVHAHLFFVLDIDALAKWSDNSNANVEKVEAVCRKNCGIDAKHHAVMLDRRKNDA